MDAAIEGRPPQAQDGQLDPAFGSLLEAMLFDADIFRAGIEFFTMLALPEEILARPGLSERVTATAHDGREVPPMSGPSRGDLLRLLA
jgi:hypothetical protein